jgi:hypothetical protein
LLIFLNPYTFAVLCFANFVNAPIPEFSGFSAQIPYQAYSKNFQKNPGFVPLRASEPPVISDN